MSRHIDFSGVWIPLVTPFRDHRVDHDALSVLVRRLAADGVAGFVVCATTGEAPLLNELRAPMTAASPALAERLRALVAGLPARA